jgi:hypothetical protein
MNLRASDSVLESGAALTRGSGGSDQTRYRRLVARAQVAHIKSLKKRYGVFPIPIDEDQVRSAVEAATVLLASRKPRERAAGGRLLASLAGLGIDFAQFADRTYRLDKGTPTENLAVRTFALRDFDRRG